MRNEKALTQKELAEEYGISVRTVASWTKIGLPRIFLGRRLVRYNLEIVRNFFSKFER